MIFPHGGVLLGICATDCKTKPTLQLAQVQRSSKSSTRLAELGRVLAGGKAGRPVPSSTQIPMQHLGPPGAPLGHTTIVGATGTDGLHLMSYKQYVDVAITAVL